MSNPLTTGNIFKKPSSLLVNGNNADTSQNAGEKGLMAPNMAPGQQAGIVNHEMVQTPDAPNSAPLPNMGNWPAAPNAPYKSGSLPTTGGLHGGVGNTYYKTGGLSTNGLVAPPAQFGGPGTGTLPAPGAPVWPNTSSPAGMPYAAPPIAPAPQPTVPTSTRNNAKPKPKGLIKRARARYNALPRRSQIILMILAVCMLFPTSIVIFEAVTAITIYSQARSGIEHITNVKNLFTGSGGHASDLLDENKLNKAQQELAAAHSDFLQLSNNLDEDGSLGLIGGIFPRQIQTIRSLSHIGVYATEVGAHLMDTGKTLAPTLRSPIMPTSATQTSDTQSPTTQTPTTPLITQDTMNLIKANIDYLLPYLDRMIPYTKNLDLSVLPISDQQKTQIGTLLQALPQARSDLALSENFLGAIAWIIGVDKPRTFLIQTMDRAELRPGGGFTGQFGILHLNGGRMSPFSLQNIGPLEENNPTAITNGNRPPAPFSWWPVANFGLRDSNISADFPTSAKISIGLAKLELQEDVDGVIVFSPFLIAHVLQTTGPLVIPKYNETITAQNLEDRLHYYQLDNAGIFKEQQVEKVQDPDQARKLFTKALSNILIQHVLKSPPDELISLSHELLYAMQTKDLQVYVTNNEVEQLLAKYASTDQIDTSPDHDGLYVVQANVSVSKASQYIRTSIQDTVTLDADGGATHVMNLRLTYTMQGSVYGWDYYRDYVRIYVPPNSQFLWGNGFDDHYQAYCGSLAGARPCQTDVYGDGTMICPANVDAGDGVNILDSPRPFRDQPVDLVGPPTNLNSDMPGRAMYAGWLNVPKNCTMTASISWHVPPARNHPYSLMLQRQSSTFPEVNLTILPTPGNCSKLQTAGMHFKGVMSGPDTLFTPPKLQGGSAGCYPDSKV